MAFLLVAGAALLAGAVNTAVGSGSLLTYPALLLVGLPPVTANMTNTVGLTPGAVAGAWAYRTELRGTRSLLVWLLPAAVVGAVAGASLLLVLPSAAFQLIVPVLIIAAALLVAFPSLLQSRRPAVPGGRRTALTVAVGGASVYGGYFSAAQGIVLLGILGVLHRGDVHTQNALKNVLQATVNVVAATFFLVTSHVEPAMVLALAVGSLAGAPVGAVLARRIPPAVFRVVVAVFGVAVGVYLLVS